MIVLLDNGHGINTKGKQSPDGRLREYKYAREIVKGIYTELTKAGIESYILTPEETDVPLSERVARANKLYSSHNKQAILISIHCNAAGNGSQWMNAQGWSVYVAQNASKNSKKLAEDIAKEAQKAKLKVRQYTNDSLYWVQSLAICRDTNCPAVLTENLFQDNKQDVEYLLSEEGKQNIINIHVQGIKNYING